MRKPRIVEVVFIETIVYLLLWLWNDFIATILCLSFAGIAISVLIISLAAERFDKSKISAWYFYFMAVSFVVPICVGTFFSVLKHGNLSWMKF